MTIPPQGTTSPSPSPPPTVLTTQTPQMADASTTTNVGAPSAYYRIDPLQGDNWPQWKRRMTAVLRERGLDIYVMGPDYAELPKIRVEGKATEEEMKKISEWKRRDGQARTQLELSIGDSEMVHLLMATTAKEMWDALVAVKEPRGALGVLASRRRLYRTTMEEGADVVAHIAALRNIQNDIHLMGERISDEEFLAVLATSLPESWDTFTQAYFGATNGISKDATGATMKITSRELAAVLIDEDRRRREKGGNDNALTFRRNPRPTRPPANDKKKEGTCHNCGKAGHFKAECWSKGGGKEGQNPRKTTRTRGNGPKGNRAEQAVGALSDNAYVTRESANLADGNSADRRKWYADTAATSHLATERSMFKTYEPSKDETVEGVGGATKVAGRGTIELECRVGEKLFQHTLKNVMHVPAAPNCLISIGRMDDAGGGATFSKGKCELRDKGGVTIAVGKKSGRLFLMGAKAKIVERALAVEEKAATWDEWHRRLAHTGMKGIEIMKSKGSVTGLNIDPNSERNQCVPCIQAKMSQKPYRTTPSERAQNIGDLTHTDLWGPAPVASAGKHIYYISLIDDATRHEEVGFLKKKSEAHTKLVNYVKALKTQFGIDCKAIRSDKGGEYISIETKEWAAGQGIILQNTAPYSPSQNGVAERRNRTWLELARAMIITKSLPLFLWAEAIKHVVYIRNMVPGEDGITPYEKWTGKKPDVSHLREWGCDVWIRNDSKKGGKLAPRAVKQAFMGFEDGPHAVRYYKRSTRQVLISRNFTWSEKAETLPMEMWMDAEGENIGDSTHPQQTSSAPTTTEPPTQAPIPPTPLTPEKPPKEDALHPRHSIIQSPQTPPTPPTHGEPVSTGITPSINRMSVLDTEEPEEPGYESEDHGDPPVSPTPAPKTKKPRMLTQLGGMTIPEPQSSGRTRRRRHKDAAAIITEKIFLSEDGPKTLGQALKLDDADEWQQAAQEEFDQLQKQGAWKLVDLPKGREAIGCRWVMTKKLNADGTVERYKARLVAQGFAQIPGIDFIHTYSPTLRLDSQRAVLALAAINGRILKQMDIKGAYLNGVLKEEIYMRQPEGFDDGSGRVCRLIKTLYGLKQAGREWNTKFNQDMINIGFTRSKADPCVYTRITEKRVTVVTVWVDDLILSTDTQDDMDRVQREIESMFDSKDLGIPQFILGIEIDYAPEQFKIVLRQTAYIKSLLQRFGMEECRPVTTPMDPNAAPKKRTTDPIDKGLYAQALGSLLYAAVCTRPDIAYALHALSQFATDPGEEHWTAVKRIFRYLKGTMDLGLTFGGEDYRSDVLECYTDADWASNEDRKSISGYTYLLAGAAVSWSAKKQPIIALSSTESEYIASTHAARHLIWLRSLLLELGAPQPTPSVLVMDNQSAMALARDDQFHPRTKHIDIRYHYIRELVQDGVLEVEYCPTGDMVADIMTKGLPRTLHLRHTYSLGLLTD